MDNRMRTPLGRVYGLGSARDGAREWWLMRLTSLALIPLTIWWVAAVITHLGLNFDDYTQWVGRPFPAMMLILTIAVTFHHMAHGLQVVIEDYVHIEWAKFTALVVVKFGCVVLAVAGIFAVLRFAAVS